MWAWTHSLFSFAGWCIFERALSSVRKVSGCCLVLSHLADGATGYWKDLEMTCQESRSALLPPDVFEAMLRDGMAREASEAGKGFRFTNGKDATAVCIPQYREAFLRLMRIGHGYVGSILGFDNCGWGDDQARMLAAALMYAHDNEATCRAGHLSLGGNRLTDAALPPLADAIAAGALPNLISLKLDHNELGDAGLTTLRPLLAGRLSGLAYFSFGRRLTAEGERTLVTLKADGHLAGLLILDLSSNAGLGDKGGEWEIAADVSGALAAYLAH